MDGTKLEIPLKLALIFQMFFTAIITRPNMKKILTIILILVAATGWSQNTFKYPVYMTADSNRVVVGAQAGYVWTCMDNAGNMELAPPSGDGIGLQDVISNDNVLTQTNTINADNNGLIIDSASFMTIQATEFAVADYAGNNGIYVDFNGGQYLLGDQSGTFNGSQLNIDAVGEIATLYNADFIPNDSFTNNLGNAFFRWDSTFTHHIQIAAGAGANKVLTSDAQGNGYWDDGVITDKTTLSSAQILDLFDTPVELVPAPGSGKMIQVLSVYGKMNFLTAAYATNTALRVYSATSSDNIYSESAILLPASSTTRATFDVDGSAVVLANSPLMVTVFGGDPTDGGGSLDVFVTYKIITE